MRTSNPALNESIFERSAGEGVMTVQGTVNKCFTLLALVALSAGFVWTKFMQPATAVGFETDVAAQAPGALMPLVIGGAIAGFVVALVTVFKKEWSGITAPLYAVCEGLFIGGISALFERSYPGIVIQAVALTFGTLFCLLAAYKTGIIRVTDKFRLGVVVATGAIALVYVVSIILGFFNIGVPFIFGNGIFGIGFSLFVVGIAALNLVLDFDLIEWGSERGAPKYMEWYSAFGLLVTLVWLYIEILKLLAKLRSRD